MRKSAAGRSKPIEQIEEYYSKSHFLRWLVPSQLRELLQAQAIAQDGFLLSNRHTMGAFSKLHNYTFWKLCSQFPGLDIKENAYPDWLISSNLTRLELDIYIEEINLAVEIQGAQHFEFIPFFHKTRENFEKRKMYDQEKRDLCYGKGIRLVEIEIEQDAEDLIDSLPAKEIRYDRTDFDSINGLKNQVIAKLIFEDIKKIGYEMDRHRPRQNKIKKLAQRARLNSKKCGLAEIPNKEIELIYQRFVEIGFIATI